MHFPQPRKYKPRYPEKYIGNPSEIVLRSSYEVKFAIWCDTNPSVLKWSSETVVIPYRNYDGTIHRYFVDFLAKIKDKNGKVTTYLIEIKPYCQSVPPVVNNRKKKSTLLQEQHTYLVNQSKWQQAKRYAEQRGWVFKVITERELAIKSPQNKNP